MTLRARGYLNLYLQKKGLFIVFIADPAVPYCHFLTTTSLSTELEKKKKNILKRPAKNEKQGQRSKAACRIVYFSWKRLIAEFNS